MQKKKGYADSCPAGRRRDKAFADSRIMLEQVRTIDRERLKEYVGHADDVTMQSVDRAIVVSLGLMEKAHGDCCFCPITAQKNTAF